MKPSARSLDKTQFLLSIDFLELINGLYLLGAFGNAAKRAIS